MDSSFDKAYYRRGLSRKALHLFKSALADFKSALDFAPNDGNIKKEYDLLRNMLNSTSKIKIDTVLKAQKFQSTTPMKEISIVNETEMSQVNSEVDAELAESIKKLVTSRNPKGYSQFEYDWRNLSTCKLEDKVEYIESISTSSVVNIFKYPFEQQMFFEVLQALSVSKKWSHSLHLLEIISKMPRFSLNMCLLGKEELAGNLLLRQHPFRIFCANNFFLLSVVSTIFRNLKQSEELDQGQVSSLHQVYSVTK